MSREEHDSRYFHLTRLSIVGMQQYLAHPTEDTEMW